MVTKNLKNIMRAVPVSINGSNGYIQLKDVYYRTVFMPFNFSSSFPTSLTLSTTLNAFAAGISIGRGDTPATENDMNLEDTITSGVIMTLTATNYGRKNVDKFYIKFTITITNTSNDPLVIKEIAYKQKVSAATSYNFTNSSNYNILIDRTVFDTPLTIQGMDAGVLVYEISASTEEKFKNGIQLVPFAYGTDAQIASMIDGARQGLINLQTDGDWAIGDVRTISFDSFSILDGNSNVQGAGQIDIVISSFDDYNNCGCLFQFDFVQSFSGGTYMNTTNTNSSGYGGSYLCTTILPSVVNALPEWLRTRLKTFDVIVGVGGGGSEVETISDNKLALRSESEVYGTSTISAPNGGSLIPIYKYIRNKYRGINHDSTSITGYYGTWLRDPKLGSTSDFCRIADNQAAGSYSAHSSYYGWPPLMFSPFGCI